MILDASKITTVIKILSLRSVNRFSKSETSFSSLGFHPKMHRHATIYVRRVPSIVVASNVFVSSTTGVLLYNFSISVFIPTLISLRAVKNHPKGRVVSIPDLVWNHNTFGSFYFAFIYCYLGWFQRFKNWVCPILLWYMPVMKKPIWLISF